MPSRDRRGRSRALSTEWDDRNALTGLSGSDSQSASSSPLEIKSNVAFKTVLSSAPALCNYSLDRGNWRRADGCVTSMHLWCKTTMSWIRCKCLMTFCKVSPLYLQKHSFAAVQREPFFVRIRVTGQQNKKRNLRKQCSLSKVYCLLL